MNLNRWVLAMLLVVALCLLVFWRPQGAVEKDVVVDSIPSLVEPSDVGVAAPIEEEPVNFEVEADTAKTAMPDELRVVRLELIVKDEANQPESGARVSLSGPVEVSMKTTSSPLVFESLPQGRYTVLIEHKRFPTLEKRLTIREDMTQTYTLKSYVLKGQVLDADRRLPINKFSVQWIGSKADGNRDKFVNTHGEYTMICTRGLLEGVRISAPGYVPQQLSMDDFTMNGSDLRRNVLLEPAGDGIKGIVVDTAGKPIAGAFVFLDSRTNTQPEFGHVKTITAQDGVFRLDPIEKAKKYIVASHPGYAPAYVMYEKEHHYRELRIRLGAGASVYGSITQAGNPAPNQSVDLMYFGDMQYGDWTAKTNAQGQYEIMGLPPGRCRLVCEVSFPKVADSPTRKPKVTDNPSRNIKFDVSLELAEGESRHHDFEIPASTGALEVHLLNPAEEDEIEGVMLQSLDGQNRMSIEGGADKSGLIAFDEIPVGRWMVLFAFGSDSSMSILRKEVEIYAEETTFVEVQLQQGTGRISGLVSGYTEDSFLMIMLYEEAFETMTTNFTEDIYALLSESIVPKNLIAFWLDFSIFGNNDRNDDFTPYSLLNIPKGEYSLVALEATEMGIDEGSIDWDVIMHEVSIHDNEETEIDIEF